ncbi:MAG: prepilin-type N-terminal cleavage/methylation domain-containing protein [Candidatus Omnitrophica bacterium]|nr:prepilin-type N-terminal cleavage/methylation domain-containing protein [Candidatus Omnitrophota bacterium]MCA9447367.1 prepilin-type N-terminal cleavage/methylation domain-containing protein [Candidatus Omnitrophota bacterium]
MTRTRGFTLIELLIVIAIILILIAIALPNFLEAQIRARVAAAKGNLRTIQTALEAYATDNVGGIELNNVNRDNSFQWGPYPPKGVPRPDKRAVGLDYDCLFNFSYGCLNYLTSPIPYMTDANAVRDPFGIFPEDNPQPVDDAGRFNNRMGYYTPSRPGDRNKFCFYYFCPYAPLPSQTNLVSPGIRDGYWVYSIGPDACAGPDGDDLDCIQAKGGVVGFWPYAPTNGTKSFGDINVIGP